MHASNPLRIARMACYCSRWGTGFSEYKTMCPFCKCGKAEIIPFELDPRVSTYPRVCHWQIKNQTPAKLATSSYSLLIAS